MTPSSLGPAAKPSGTPLPSPAHGCDVVCDGARNLLQIRYVGCVAAADTKVEAEKLDALLAPLRKGFTLYADLSGLDSMELDCAPSIAKIMDKCRAKGISCVVRVIPDPDKDIGFNILSIVHYRRGVRVVTCQSRAEAERYLPR